MLSERITLICRYIMSLRVAAVLFMGGAWLSAGAFAPESYAAESVLASGQWGKVAVTVTGMHFIDARTLASMGFSDPSTVSVHGYGGQRISDVLSADNFIDDLPEVPAVHTPDGIFFYARGVDAYSTRDGEIIRTINPYANEGYYFITQNASPLQPQQAGEAIRRGDAATTALAVAVHELDRVSYGQTGNVLLGEDFRLTPTRKFTLATPGRIKQTPARLRLSFASRASGTSTLTVTAGGKTLTSPSPIDLSPTRGNDYGTIHTSTLEFIPDATCDNPMEIELRFAGSGLVRSANLDALSLTYTRRLELTKDNPSLEFDTDNPAVSISCQGMDEVKVMDVTDPQAPILMTTTQATDGAVSWVNPYTGRRRYAAWSGSGSLGHPEPSGSVGSQDLHGAIMAARPHMIIIHAPGLRKQAERLAAIHTTSDSMTVLTVDIRQAFNEFSSGTFDPGALRRLLKMAYDTSGGALQYAVIMGRGWFDNRALTGTAPFGDSFRTPAWQSDESMAENVSFTTDDYLAMLSDNAGLRPTSDEHCIAIGRIPARSAREADTYISKLEKHLAAPAGAWQSRAILLADDGDRGVHMNQIEKQAERFAEGSIGSRLIFDKIYLDAYPLKGGVCTQGRKMLHSALDEGAAWWQYVGHGNKYYITSQGVMTLNDIISMTNRRYPVFFGATCYFMQIDGSDQSGAEKMLFNSSGGVVVAISATRPVFISENGQLASAVTAEAGEAGSDGRPLTAGEIVRRAKNRLASPGGGSNSNKLRYSLIGDPAVRPSFPTLRTCITEINGMVPDTASIELHARGTVTITGRIVDPDGLPYAAFDGRINATLYDADESVLTLGRDIDGTEGKRIIYDTRGPLLTSVSDTVTAGNWSVTLTVPEQIADNYRSATLRLTAASTNGKSASGIERGLYVYGTDMGAPTDTVAPVIELLTLDNADFADGAVTGAEPMLLATVTDNVGISLSSAGVGRTMTLIIDGKDSHNDIASYYTPLSDGRIGGTIAYPLPRLQSGEHTLEFRAFDTAGNMAERIVTFRVDPDLSPEIVDIYTDANPATAEANFYVSHNRPDSRITVCVSVYSLMGRLVWTSTATDRSDMFTSAPIRWDLTDRSGRRVERGIYIYRAEIIGSKSRNVSKGRKLAVAAQ